MSRGVTGGPSAGSGEAAVPVTFIASHAVRGGAEAVLRTLLDELGQNWVSGVIVLQEGPLVAELRAAGHPVTVVPCGRRIGLPAGAFRLRRELRGQRPAVVHANGIKAALVAAVAMAGTTTPLLWMRHDTAGDGWPARLVALRCAAVVGVSRTVLGTFGPWLSRRTHLVYNGLPPRSIDRADGRRRVEATLGCGSATPVVALVGRLALGKGQLELVEAAPAILAGCPSARFAIVGAEDPAFPGLADRVTRRARELGVADAMTLIGRREDAAAFISGCDLVVAPSIRDPGGWSEGFGLVVAEALQAGTPVVAYANGSLPEVLGNAGRIVPEGDREALAAAVVAVLRDPVLGAELARRGQARASSSFTLRASIDGMAAIYRRLAAP